MRDSHRVLRVDKGASLLDIKRSYRRLARQHHPDKGGDPSIFRQLNEAYRYLAHTDEDGDVNIGLDADTDLATYLDETLFADADHSGISDGPNYGASDTPVQLYPVSVPLTDICQGNTIDVMVTRTVVDQKRLRPCQHCNGTGVEILYQRIPGNLLGFGITPDVSCTKCLNGFVTASIQMIIEHDNLACVLPAGCPSGLMFRFPSKGDHLPGVPQTDLVVVIRYQQDGVFSVPTHTLDLQCSLAITLYESLVGFTRTVIHPDGTNHHLEGMSVTKPAVYVVPGHGIRFVQDERRGDLYVDIHVEYPTTVDLRANTLRSILCTDQDAPSAVSAHQEYHPLISIDNATSIRVDDILAHNHQTIYPTRNV